MIEAKDLTKYYGSGENRYDNEDITTFSDNRLTEFRRKKHCFYFSAILSPAAHERCPKCKNGCSRF